MKRELLKELGLDDAAIDQIMAENGKDIEKYKGTSETQKTELDGLKTQLAERDKQLKDLQANAGDSEALKQQLSQLQAQNAEQQKAYEQQMQALKFKTALDTELLKANVIDADLINVKLDQSKIKLNDDGTVSGLSEQLAGLKKDYSFLFKQQEQTTIVTGAEPANKTAPVNKKPEEMTYSEMMAYKAQNPDAQI